MTFGLGLMIEAIKENYDIIAKCIILNPKKS